MFIPHHCQPRRIWICLLRCNLNLANWWHIQFPLTLFSVKDMPFWHCYEIYDANLSLTFKDLMRPQVMLLHLFQGTVSMWDLMWHHMAPISKHPTSKSYEPQPKANAWTSILQHTSKHRGQWMRSESANECSARKNLYTGGLHMHGWSQQQLCIKTMVYSCPDLYSIMKVIWTRVGHL